MGAILGPKQLGSFRIGNANMSKERFQILLHRPSHLRHFAGLTSHTSGPRMVSGLTRGRGYLPADGVVCEATRLKTRRS